MLRGSSTISSVLLVLGCLIASGCARGLTISGSDIDPFQNDDATSGYTNGSGGAKAFGGTTAAKSVSSVTSTVAVTSVAETNAAGPSVTSGGQTCDVSDCGTCGNCAISGQCAPQMTACETNQDCTALLDCLQTCTDQTCADSCATQYPNGMQIYNDFVMCVVCDACPITCDGAASGCQ